MGVNTVEQVVVGYAQTEPTVSSFHRQESAELVISRERERRKVYSSEKSVNELLREVVVCGISSYKLLCKHKCRERVNNLIANNNLVDMRHNRD